MKPDKPSAAVTPRRAAKTPGRNAIVRAVASSTAIETGKSVQETEKTLLSKNPKQHKFTLAD